VRATGLLLALVACGGVDRSRPTVVTAAPSSQPASAPAAPEDLPTKGDPWKGRADLIVPPPPAKPAPVALPPVVRFTLPDGLRVLVVASHDLPVVTMHLAVGAGGLDEPKGKRSLSDFAAAMLTQGTPRHSSDEIADTMSFVGGSLFAQADLESTHVVCQVVATEVGACTALLPEVVATPTFPKPAVKAVADELLAALKRQRENGASLAGVHLLNLLWGEGNVRGWPHTAEQVAAVTREDLVAWHRQRFVPANAVLAVVGDVDPDRLRAELGRAFAVWRAGAAPARKGYPEPKLRGLSIRLVDKPDQAQAQIAVGGLGIAHRDPDYRAALLANAVLGGGGSSRLAGLLRARTTSELERWKARGMFHAETATGNGEAVATLRILLGEIARLRQSGPTADELAAAKSYLAGRYVIDLQTAADVAGALVVAELHGLGDGYVRDFPVALDGVPLDDAKAAARKHLDADNLAVVIVGKADEVAAGLDGAGLTYARVGWQEPVSPRARPPRLPVDETKTAVGRKLLDEALAAKGGADRLRAVKDLHAVGKVRLQLGDREVTGAWDLIAAPPDRRRVAMKLGGQTLVLTVAGDAAWQQSGAQVQDMPEEIARQERAALWHDHDFVLLRHLDSGTIVQAAGTETVEGKGYATVLVRAADGSNQVKIFLDPETHFISRLTYPQYGGTAVEDYADYRKVGGIWFPYRQRAAGGTQTIEVTLGDLQVNAGVPPGSFDKPK
jgi:predicted Zn-dependent peptidase